MTEEAAQIASWFYGTDNNRKGPYTLDEMRRFAQSGMIDHGTEVWTPDFGPIWKPASQTQVLGRAAPESKGVHWLWVFVALTLAAAIVSVPIFGDGAVKYIVYLAVLAPLYLVPTIVAEKRNHYRLGSIFFTNIATGWTGLGWVGTLAWATMTTPIAPVVLPKHSSSGPGIFGTAALIGLAAWFFWPTGFSDEEIGRIKDSIREEYSKRPGTTVLDVSMLREERRKLAGFVKLKSTNGILGEYTKACTATMADDGKNYLWRCQ